MGEQTGKDNNGQAVQGDSMTSTGHPYASTPSASPPGKPRGKGFYTMLIGGIALVLAAVLTVAILVGHGADAVVSSFSSSVAEPPKPQSESVPQMESAPLVISEPEGPNWSELVFFTEEETARLNGMLDSWAAVAEEEEEMGHSVAVYFKDLDSGAEYIYNGEKVFYMASLNKAPYALYLYHLAETGQTSLDTEIYVTAEGVSNGDPEKEESGRIRNDETLPRNYTLEELILNLLRYSDTGALRVLRRHYPEAGLVEYAGSEWGLAEPERLSSLLRSRVSAQDTAIYLDRMYDYMENGQYGAQLKENLLNAQHSLIRSEYPVAHKYGWDIDAYHDMAIVYAEHPYAIAILTGKSNGSPAENGMFATITSTFEEIMSAKWDAVADVCT